MGARMLRKGLAVAVILLFIGVAFAPSINAEIESNESTYTDFLDDGSLSGYVYDTNMEPIGGALVRVYFHETYEENYTNSYGYYHVTNIPICWCMKNCTASKEDYVTEWVYLSIGESTTYNFVLEQDDSDLVELEVEFCGLGKKHTVQLTQQEADEVNLLFVELYKNLEVTASKEDRNTIITQAVLELDKYGLLGSLHIEQARKLVLNEYVNDKAIPPFETLSHENSIQENQNNFFCFVSGTVYDGYATGQLGMIGVILALLGMFVLGMLLMVMSDIIVTIFPLSVMQSITIFSANIISLGILGFKNHTIPPHSGTAKIFGFNGIKLTNIDTGEINLLGFALAVIDFSND